METDTNTMTLSNNGEDGITGECLTSHVDTGSVESHKLYLARRTTMEMLTDRGYIVESENTPSLAEFRSVFGETPDLDRLRFLAHRDSNPSKKVLVIFCGSFEIKKQNMVGILGQIMNKESLDRVILVLQGGINSHARKVLEEYSVKAETFQITDLLVNITKHALQPKYVFLNAEEKQVLMEKFSIEDKQLPKMLENDAIARYYGLQKGQVVKLTYAGDITGTLVNYRCVV